MCLLYIVVMTIIIHAFEVGACTSYKQRIEFSHNLNNLYAR